MTVSLYGGVRPFLALDALVARAHLLTLHKKDIFEEVRAKAGR